MPKGVEHGAAVLRREGARRVQHSMGGGMAMLNQLSALQKMDGIDQEHVLSATGTAVLFRRGRRRHGLCALWSMSSS